MKKVARYITTSRRDASTDSIQEQAYK